MPESKARTDTAAGRNRKIRGGRQRGAITWKLTCSQKRFASDLRNFYQTILTMNGLREHWEGAVLPGDYTLEQWLGGDESAAFFQTALPSDGRRAAAKLTADATALDLWNRTRQLDHPNLVALLDCGSAEHAGETAAFAIFEFPDDTLAPALEQAPLGKAEAREVLDAILRALRYLHGEGLALGALDADRIVAIGDRVKLASDDLREATPSACSEDIRLLGIFWQQALGAASPRSAEIAAHAADRNPDTRWTLDEITRALDSPAPVLPPPPQPRRVETVDPEPAPSRRLPRWPFAAAAVLLVVIFLWNRQRPADPPAPPPVTIEAPAPASTPAAAPAPSKAAAAEGKEMWRVVAFTYRTREAAARKVKQLNERNPGLDAAVFSPGGRNFYLVTIGGRMTREKAVHVQRTARGKGLPRDLYVQNYSQ